MKGKSKDDKLDVELLNPRRQRRPQVDSSRSFEVFSYQMTASILTFVPCRNLRLQVHLLQISRTLFDTFQLSKVTFSFR